MIYRGQGDGSRLWRRTVFIWRVWQATNKRLFRCSLHQRSGIEHGSRIEENCYIQSLLKNVGGETGVAPAGELLPEER